MGKEKEKEKEKEKGKGKGKEKKKKGKGKRKEKERERENEERKKEQKRYLEAIIQILSNPLGKLLELLQVLRVGAIKLASNLEVIKSLIEVIISKV